MMRKFPQILAVVLAIAILICPAINLTPIANTSANNYNISYDEDDSVVTVNVSAADGFIAALVRLSVVGYTINEDTNISVSSADPTDPSVTDLSVAVHDSDIVDGVLSILITDADNAKARLISSATISIPVIRDETVTEEVGITLSYIQAADGGEYDVNNNVLRSEELIVFPHVDNAENGAINLEAAVAAGMTLTVADVPPHECTAVTYSDNGDGTHDGICDCDAETVVVDNEAHDFTNGDCVCGAKAPVAECQHENTQEVITKEATCTTPGLKNIVCADCGEPLQSDVEIPAIGHTFADGGCATCGEEYLTFSNPTYTFENSKLTVDYAAFEGKLFDSLMSTAKASGTRVVKLLLTVSGNLFELDAPGMYKGGGNFGFEGLSLNHVATDVEMKLRVSWTDKVTGEAKAFDTNAVVVDVVDVVTNNYNTDVYVGNEKALAEAWLNIYNLSNASTETIQLEDVNYGTGLLDYSNATYSPSTSKFLVDYAAFADKEFGDIMTEAKLSGTRVVRIMLNIGGKEYEVLNPKLYTGGGNTGFTGLSLYHLSKDFEFSIRVNWTDTETQTAMERETNKVTLNFHDMLMSDEESEFAIAYQAYNEALALYKAG